MRTLDRLLSAMIVAAVFLGITWIICDMFGDQLASYFKATVFLVAFFMTLGK